MRSRHLSGVSQKTALSYPEYIVLSGLSAMVGATCVFPMDKASLSPSFSPFAIFNPLSHALISHPRQIKTRLQTTKGAGNIITTFRGIIQKEGVFRLYRGLQAQLVGITP